MVQKKFVDIKNAGDRVEYVAILKQILKDGVCPFCPEYFVYHPKPILRSGQHWLVTENISPYRGTKHHFLFVHKKHIENLAQLSPAAAAELASHAAWLTKKYKLPGGALFMRFGDKRYTGASVTQHLHAQLISGSKNSRAAFTIHPTLGFGKKK